MTRRLEGCGRDELAFSGPRGSNGIPPGARSRLSVGNCRRAYRLAMARAELPDLDPHALRHTFATWLEDGGVPARVIAERLAVAPAVMPQVFPKPRSGEERAC
jgi:integrase/recombinase XerC